MQEINGTRKRLSNAIILTPLKELMKEFSHNEDLQS